MIIIIQISIIKSKERGGLKSAKRQQVNNRMRIKRIKFKPHGIKYNQKSIGNFDRFDSSQHDIKEKGQAICASSKTNQQSTTENTKEINHIKNPSPEKKIQAIEHSFQSDSLSEHTKAIKDSIDRYLAFSGIKETVPANIECDLPDQASTILKTGVSLSIEEVIRNNKFLTEKEQAILIDKPKKYQKLNALLLFFVENYSNQICDELIAISQRVMLSHQKIQFQKLDYDEIIQFASNEHELNWKEIYRTLHFASIQQESSPAKVQSMEGAAINHFKNLIRCLYVSQILVIEEVYISPFFQPEKKQWMKKQNHFRYRDFSDSEFDQDSDDLHSLPRKRVHFDFFD